MSENLIVVGGSTKDEAAKIWGQLVVGLLRNFKNRILGGWLSFVLCWGWGKDRCKGGVGDSIPGVAVVVKSKPGFLDQDNVCGFVCKVEECLHNVC